MDPTLLFICCLAILLMQLGFLSLEAGQVRAKNSLNVAYKNLFDLAISVPLFWFVGYGLVFGWQLGEPLWGQLIATQLAGPESLHLLLQALFCATAATIVSGAIAERGSLRGYVAIVLLSGLLIYPLAALLVWGRSDVPGAGWLYQLGFRDLAGASVVHGVGGAIALAAIIIIGPRLGRFDTQTAPLPSHPLMSVAGTVLLWIGWLGFNTSALLDKSVATYAVVLNTLIAGAAGFLTASLISQLQQGYVHMGWACNGIIAGLVAVTASAHAVTVPQSLLIATVGAVLAIYAAQWLENKGLDDVIGAVPTHLVAGFWGTLAVGLFADLDLLGTALSRSQQIAIQVMGAMIICGWALASAWCLLSLINKRVPLRVDRQQELDGLDQHRHGIAAELINQVLDLQHQSQDSDTVFETSSEQTATTDSEESDQPLGQLASKIDTMEKPDDALALMAEKIRAFVDAKQQPRHAAQILIEIEQLLQQQSQHKLSDDLHAIIEDSQQEIQQLRRVAPYVSVQPQVASTEDACFDVHTAVDQALTLTRSLVPAHIHVTHELSAVPLWVNANLGQLSQIIIVLISNATDAMTSEGILRLVTQREDDWVFIDVIDTGSGIDSHDLPRLFEADFSTKASGKTPALGLSECRELVERHDGRIAVMSQPGKGSRFRIIFPCSAPPPIDQPSPAPARPEHSS